MDDGSRKLVELQERLAHLFADPALLAQALTHASVSAGTLDSNERLEFLGDAVVGLAVSDWLFRAFPGWSEGRMTQAKSEIVSSRTLARVGQALGLHQCLQVDQGLKRRAAYTEAMMSAAYEAIIGAALVDGGMSVAQEIVLRTLAPELERLAASRHSPDCKSILQQRTQADAKGIPVYGIARVEGPDHRRRFQAVVQIDGVERGWGWGAAKRAAEQAAALQALNDCYPGWSDQAVGGSSAP